jgi:hypothetical protein
MSRCRQLAFIALSLGLLGCSGSGGSGGGGDSTSSAAAAGAAPASVSFSASSSVVASGATVTLNWSSNRADGCTASGGWSGSKSLAGSLVVGPLSQDTNFTLSCSGAGGGAVSQLTVQVDDGKGVSVTLTASPQSVVSGDNVTLTWSSDNATQCTASGGWSGTQPIVGSFIVGPVDAAMDFQITCDGQTGSALAMVSVWLVDKILRWQAPTQNVDGSALTDLAGYRVYWGASSRNYTGNHTINSVAVTQWEATIAAGDYYFALTAFDTQDNESAYSNEVRKTIP